LRYFFAIETTRRRFASTICCFAPWSLDALRELHFLRRGQELDAPDVLQEELERIGRDLARLLVQRHLLGALPGGHDLDLKLVESVVEVVDLTCLELELVECERDLLGVHAAGLLCGFEEPPGLLGLEHVCDGSTPIRYCAQLRSPSPAGPVSLFTHVETASTALADGAACQRHGLFAIGRSAHLSVCRS
jgi:hypothetical protein